MRTLSLFALVTLFSCGLFQPQPTTPTDVIWPQLLQCGPDVNEIVGTISRILLDDGPSDQTSLTERARTELQQLAQQHGADTVACMVDLLIRQWTAPNAAASPERVAGAARGSNFLVDVGTRVQSNAAAQ